MIVMFCTHFCFGGRGGGTPYSGLNGLCGPIGYGFRDFGLKRFIFSILSLFVLADVLTDTHELV